MPSSNGTIGRTDWAAESPVLTPAEAAAYLRLNELGKANPIETLNHLVKSRQLECSTVAGCRVYFREQLDRYLFRDLEPAPKRLRKTG